MVIMRVISLSWNWLQSGALASWVGGTGREVLDASLGNHWLLAFTPSTLAAAALIIGAPAAATAAEWPPSLKMLTYHSVRSLTTLYPHLPLGMFTDHSVCGLTLPCLAFFVYLGSSLNLCSSSPTHKHMHTCTFPIGVLCLQL